MGAWWKPVIDNWLTFYKNCAGLSSEYLAGTPAFAAVRLASGDKRSAGTPARNTKRKLK